MLIDKTHRSWFLISAIILVAAAGSYFVYASSSANGPSGGSIMGLLYGIVGSAMMIFAALLAARKKVPTWRIGSAQFWLRGHLWLGSLSIVLILFHSGFGWGGRLENVLWITFAVVVATGAYGLGLQHMLPRYLTTRVPNETFNDQLPFLCASMQFLADKAVAERCGKLDVDHDPVRSAAAAVARQKRWLKREGDFEALLHSIYANAPAPPKKSAPERKSGPAAVKPTIAVKPAAAKPGLSPLEQMKAKTAAAKNSASADQPAAAGTKTAGDKPKSPLELARAQAAAKKNQAAATDTASGDKPKSPLELARAQATAKKNQAATTQQTPPADPTPKTHTVTADIQPQLDAIRKLLTGKYGYSQDLVDRLAANVKPFLTGSDKSSTPVAQPTTMPSVKQRTPKPASPKPAPTTPAAKLPVPPKKPATQSKASDRAIPRTDELKQFYLQYVRPFLNHSGVGRSQLNLKEQASRVFAQIRSTLPIELHDTLNDLQNVCEERRQFVIQKQIHGLLHGWLIIHIPASIMLLVLFVVHVVVALRVVPWNLPWPF